MAILSLGVMRFLDATYAEADAAPVPGVLAPQTATVSGGPGSLVQWQSLGTEGRLFTAGAVSTDALRTFRPSSEPPPPIRVYVGLKDAPDAAARNADDFRGALEDPLQGMNSLGSPEISVPVNR